MKKNFFAILFLIFSFQTKAQITVHDNQNLVDLVQKLKGTGVEISNISYDCQVNQYRPYGYYQDIAGGTGLKEGMLLTTGLARNAVPPNNESGKGVQNNSQEKFDNDLLQLVSSSKKESAFFDICKVEFDISIYSDELSFEYIFASEEYPEFIDPNDGFHDVFGFFISGPGIFGTKNLALIPNSNTPVSVSTVNHSVNSFYYKKNGEGSSPPYSPVMQYDGYTKKLTAKTEVIPCETYHIKLIIADEGDGIYDSGIFLEAGSFKSSDERLSTRFEYAKFDFALEGCNKGYFIFSRIGKEKNDLSQPVVVNYSISGSAINGTDYDSIQNSITIPAFQNFVELEINAFSDSLIEGSETVSISILNDCPALPPIFIASLSINDSFEHTIPPIEICKSEITKLNTPSNTFGFSILWEDSLDVSCTTCSSPTVQPDSSASFTYVLTDSLSGCKTKGTADVIISPPPIAFFTHNLSDFYTNLDVFFNNESTEANHFLWEFGDGDTTNDRHPIHTYANSINNFDDLEFKVTLLATNSITGCKDTFTDIIQITDPFLIPNIITPNKDNENDAFYITGIQSDVWQLRIYNRWGKTIFKTEKYNNRWQAKNIPDGVYYYDLINPNKDRKFKGWLQITR